MKKIIDDHLYYVGVNDRHTDLFEGLWPLPHGVSYNSYLVAGAEKIALIDGVEASEVEHLKRHIEEAMPGKSPDYLVVNHMEPDHSGSLPYLLKSFPNIKIVGNSKTLDMAKGFYALPESSMMQVKDGESLDLGNLRLQFFLTPMVHWPETMMTYCPELKTLFAGDAFGCFGALNGAVVDADMDTDVYFPEMYRYYSNIVGKYGVFVQKALSKVGAFPMEYICSTHGPVWHDKIKEVISIYDRLSRYEGEDGVVIVYGSMYGHTERMADAIATRLSQLGEKNIKIYDASRTNMSFILSDIFKYRGLVIGAPTYSNSLFPPIESLLNAIKLRELKNRAVAVFGSYTWGSQAVKRIYSYLEDCKLANSDFPIAEAKQAPSAEAMAMCYSLAEALYKYLYQ